MKIQISQTTEGILRYLGSFTIEYRGAVQIKGKGEMNTYWLIGERQGDLGLPTGDLVRPNKTPPLAADMSVTRSNSLASAKGVGI